ncbi:hypothetical protein Mal15_12170 [Stieleria maiorica]|uniref:Uncharacterized protein n=1 Tax=Stieleria maiorica TaxID=2795974 RepID=A0A5B9M9H6_9BACT|nr:hypothetical protein [Stieleria maiorica]QEF97179.1 hypothetical protein Mal15_12170 [Stieleria maiorica]
MNEMQDFESWEDHCHFHDRRDYAGLVAYCKDEVKRAPNDLYAAERLLQALFLTATSPTRSSLGRHWNVVTPAWECSRTTFLTHCLHSEKLKLILIGPNRQASYDSALASRMIATHFSEQNANLDHYSISRRNFGWTTT